jgi:phosphatidylserine/phosphatidylglycerophosphate/cardiolipin synthase-like enzyme
MSLIITCNRSTLVEHNSYIHFIFNFDRESEPNSWEDTMKDELDREKYPRMPWHDVHCALWGPPCRDIARHFVQRWNYAKVRLILQLH